MAFQIGDVAPDFRARSTRGNIHFYDWLADAWAVMLTYSEPVTDEVIEEIRAIEGYQADFEKLACKVIGMVAESAGDFGGWIDTLSGALGETPFFPIATEGSPEFPGMGGVGRSDGAAVRTLLVIGPDKRVKLAIANPIISLSRFGEILRLIESLQYASARRKTKTSAEGLIVLPCAPSEDDCGGVSEFQLTNGRKKDMRRRGHC